MGVTQDLPAVLRLRLLLQVEKKDNFMISYVNFFSLKCYSFLFQLQKGFCKLIGWLIYLQSLSMGPPLWNGSEKAFLARKY